MIVERSPKVFYGYIIVIAIFVIMAVVVGGANSFGVFFEPLLLEFGWTRAMTSGAFSLSLLLSGLLAMVFGKLNDRFGPRLILTVGSVLLGLGYLLMSQISDIWQLYLFYGVIIGIAFSSHVSPLHSTIARWFAKRRGMMTGVVGTGTGIGTIIIPQATGWLISSYGWRNSFLVTGISTLVLVVIAAQFLKRSPQNMGQLPDGETGLKRENLPLETRGFSFQEALRTKQLWMISVVFLCAGFSIFTILAHIVIHATGLGITTTNAVNIMTIIGGINITGRLVMGSINDRTGPRSVIIISFIVMLASLVWLQFATELWMLYFFGALFGFSWGGLFIAHSPMIAEYFGLDSHGVLFGFIQTSMLTGGTVGPVLTGYTFDTVGNYQSGFLILAIVSFIGLIMVLLLKPIRKGNVSNFMR